MRYDPALDPWWHGLPPAVVRMKARMRYQRDRAIWQQAVERVKEMRNPPAMQPEWAAQMMREEW